MGRGALDSTALHVPQEVSLRMLEGAFTDCEARVGRPATNVELCEELDIKLQELYELIGRHRGLGLGKFEDLAGGESHNGPELVKYVPYAQDEEIFYIFSKSALRTALSKAIDALPKNEQLVFFLRYRQRLTFSEIAAIVGFSESRVTQIHTTAMMRIRPKLLELEAYTPDRLAALSPA